ncbi:MAG: tryptophan synthase subunit alpha [Planctomycetaceae bacterium]|nr:tryptophan synthase subunit alpha [Planctomycetaceae bacterium]
MNRVTKIFEQLKRENRVALIGFLMAGDPDFEQSFEIVGAACDAGFDVLELGIPFSDPVADGPVIRRASQRAIQSGMTLEKGLHFVRRLREKHDLPIIVCSYYQPIVAFGVERFVTEAMDVGVDGTLVVDMPGENADELLQYVGKHREFHFIRLILPTTDKARRSEILREADGFVYCVSRRGVTGVNPQANAIDWNELAEKMSELRVITAVPLCIGFGISTAEDVRAVAKIADGAVIGSAFQQVIEENPETAKTRIGDMISEFRSHALAAR